MPLSSLYWFLVLAYTSAVFGCDNTIYSEFKYNNSFHILRETVTKEDIHQVHLQEHLCMDNDFCFIRNYNVLIGSQSKNNNSDCPLQFPIAIINMEIKKVAFNPSYFPLMVGNQPPMLLKDRLQELIVDVEMNTKLTSGVWNVDRTCWTKHERSLKKCGRNFLLYEKMMNPLKDAMKLTNWILEPVNFLKGNFRKFYLHIWPAFFLQGMQNILNCCCFKEIHIDGSNMANATIQHQKQLLTLFVRYTNRNQIKADLKTMSQITSLSLPETAMATLPKDLKYLYNLKELDVYYNNLTFLPSDLLSSKQLQILNVSKNFLTTLPFNITQLSDLRILNISSNKITVNVLRQISYLQHLQILDLSYNPIEGIPKELSNLKNLQELNLNYNSFLSYFNFLNISEPFASLQVLKLSNTGYTMNNGVDILEKLSTLQYLDLSGNEKFAWAYPPFKFLRGKVNLKFLNLSGIDMQKRGCLGSEVPPEDGEFEPLLNLKVLDLSKCKLQYLNASTFEKIPNIEYLDLSFNKLTTLPVNLTLSLKNLKELYLSQNILTTVQLNVPVNLVIENLDLSHNQIISPAHTVNFGRVKKLDLSYNSVTTWDDPNIFVNWVQVVDLSYNYIDFPNINMRKSFEVLQSVNLNSNPVDCRQCRIEELQKWLMESSPHNIKNFTCAWPLDQKGKEVATVKIDLQNCTKGNFVDMPLIISMTVLASSLIATAIFLYRYRLKIAYTVQAIGMKRRYKAKCNNEEKEYDAFVCYSGLDSNWVCNELSPSLEKEPENYKFCIHERDFPVGTFIMRNIDKSIKKSRHTIVILTNKFLSSSWCRWELELTNYTMIHEDRDLIIMIELEHLDKHKIPSFLKFLMNTRTYLEWPKNDKDQAARELAWRRLRSALGVSLFQQKLKNTTTL